jgi:sulfite reductase (NADPH) hemoprotein beta-component
MCTVDPLSLAMHAEVAALAKHVSDHVIPKTRGYHEIWYGNERVTTSDEEEPFYGASYMPRKFKIGFALPPSNDIDVYAQDLGLIAIGSPDNLEGFNVAIGGGMGRTDKSRETYPRLADVIGFVSADQLIACVDATMSVQRDYGDRKNRLHARFKYTIDDKGLSWIKEEIERRMGFVFEPARSFFFKTNGDRFGWTKTNDGLHHFTLFVENGRLFGALMDGLRDIARIHRGKFHLTPNQNLTIGGISEQDKPAIERMLESYGLAQSGLSALRRNSMACVALPTCGLAMAESERYLPSLITKIEALLDERGLADMPITMRMTGCPNGCSRPYIAEIALTGRAPGKYNFYLGGGFHGQRLNRMFQENIGEDAILKTLGQLFTKYAQDRNPDEPFGDFCIRAGIVQEVTEGRLSND